MTATDARRFLRLPIRVVVKVRDTASPGEGELLFDSVDLSQGGAFLESELLLEVGEEVLITFRLPGHERDISARARVARATRSSDPRGASGMGLEFVELDAADKDAIAAHLRAARGS